MTSVFFGGNRFQKPDLYREEGASMKTKWGWLIAVIAGGIILVAVSVVFSLPFGTDVDKNAIASEAAQTVAVKLATQRSTPSIAVTLNTMLPTASMGVTATIAPTHTKAPIATYLVVAKENPDDKTKTDLYVKNSLTGESTFFITLTDVYRGHYHVGEFHHGNLYVIRRPGGENAFETNPDWTDELWQCDSQKQCRKVFSGRGLDFRVSDDERTILVLSEKSFQIFDFARDRVKGIPFADLSVSPEMDLGIGFTDAGNNPIDWSVNSIWLTNYGGPTLDGLVQIDPQTFGITKFSLIGMGVTEYAFRAKTKKIAFSNRRVLLDTDSMQKYLQSGEKVNLTVYDLTTHALLQIATSITKPFAPKWIDDHTLEYDDPGGAGRVTTTIP
jgi:hypothetical protein